MLLLETDKSAASDFAMLKALAGGTKVFEIRGDGGLTLEVLEVMTLGATVFAGGLNVVDGGATVADGGARVTTTETSASPAATISDSSSSRRPLTQRARRVRQCGHSALPTRVLHPGDPLPDE